MAYAIGKNLGTINNMHVRAASLHWTRDNFSATTYGDPVPVKIGNAPELRCDFELFGLPPSLDDSFDLVDWLRQRMYSDVSSRALGPGAVCQYCGTVWLPGTLKCQSCGGITTQEIKVMEKTYDGTVDHVEVRGRVDRAVEVYFSIVYFGNLLIRPDFNATLQSIVRRSVFGEPGDWLCPWCGFMCKGLISHCPGCGGNKLTIDQLSNLRRVCVYCGRETIGGYACPTCNARLREKPTWLK